jgi:hypothetical protein
MFASVTVDGSKQRDLTDTPVRPLFLAFSDKLLGQWTCLIYFVLYRMTPPPPKFGSRSLFNDSFLSFLRWNKSQLAPPHHPDSPGGTEELQEKRYLLSEGHDFLDKTKTMLEEYPDIFGKEATKRLRKSAAK